jgi:predicted GNAT family N-acyltransferase
MPDLTLEIVPYAEAELILKQIRIRVFQEEQGVSAELEFDGQDAIATHFLAHWQGQPVGTLRLRPLNETTLKLERLAVLPAARGQGIATALTQAALDYAQTQAYQTVTLHAQAYIQALYQRFGFTVEGDEFSEAGIPHVKMCKILSAG